MTLGALCTWLSSTIDLAAGGEARRDEILHHFVLAVDGDAAPAREVGEVDAVAPALEAQLDAVMDESLALHALADAGLDEKIDPRPASTFSGFGSSNAFTMAAM